MIQNFIFGILFNIITGIQLFYIHPHISVHIIRVFFISDFLAEILKADKN